MEENNKDREYEKFVLKQVLRYADSNKKASYVYVLISAAAVVMAVLVVVLRHEFWAALMSLGMAAGFFSARRYYIGFSSHVYDVAEEIESAIENPDFRIPDDYSEEVQNIRKIVLPTTKNTWSQIIAYGIIAISCFLGGLIIAAVTGPWADGFSVGIFCTSLILFGMGIVLASLSLRSVRDLKMAAEYSEYLREKKD